MRADYLYAATSARVITASHPNSEVKLARARVVLRWGTTREGRVLHIFYFGLIYLDLLGPHVVEIWARWVLVIRGRRTSPYYLLGGPKPCYSRGEW